MPFRPCTADGHHNVTGLNLAGVTDACTADNNFGFREIFIRCHEDETIEVIRDCGTTESGEVASENEYILENVCQT
jgi:hypothetical protein